MPKAYTKFVCSTCGYETPKWMGRCPDCGEWNSLVEEVVRPASPGSRSAAGGRGTTTARSQPIGAIDREEHPRRVTGIGEFDRAFRRASCPAPHPRRRRPGIGKSTPAPGRERPGRAPWARLYVSGEESTQQISCAPTGFRSRGGAVPARDRHRPHRGQVAAAQPQFLIIDSIQTMHAGIERAPGTVVRECTARLMRLAKATHLPVFLVGT